MLQIVTGPFHPHLQQALIREVRQFKTDNPLGSLAIIVPSSTLSHYLRRLLVLKAGLSLLNVHFLTFHQLALRLCEAGGPVTGSGTAPVVPGSDLFFEELLRTIVRRNLTGLERFRQFGHSQGAWAALWATLRDLTEAMVDPETARRAVEEGLFGIEDAEPLRALFHLHAAAREACRALGVGTPEDVAAAALERVPDSAVLLRLDRLYYYGFYDLTQVQLALFEAIAASRPVTLFFPLTDQPEFGFARRFFERHLSPRTMAQYVARLPDPPTARGHGPAILRFSTVEAEDELATVCKQILLLVETHGYRFEEIGVVARTLAPYQAKLRPIFDRHRIPLQSLGDALPGGAGLPLNQEPAAKALLQLASLPVTGLYRTPVMDVLTSPFCRWDRLGEKIEPRPDLWTLAVRQLGITRGLDEWQRLAAAAQDGLVLEAGAEMDDGETEPERSRSIAPSQLHLLWRLVSGLLEEIRALPASGSFGELTAAFLKVASGQLKVPGLSEAGQLDLPEPRLDAVGQSIRAVFTALAQFEQIGHAVSWEEWLRVFTRLVAEATVADCEQNHGGVWVLDAMAARGLAFRALFLIGLNEKVFPRFIREDAFLRDRHRRVLDATLGYKIDEKLAGYDEERLLFTLLVQAAQERLFLLYQRADAAGRALVPSGYLAGTGPDVSVPRRLLERVGISPFLVELLDHEEYARREILSGRDPSPLLEAVGRSGLVFGTGEAALRLIEADAEGPGPYDGITGPLEAHWRELSGRGCSPTALERYARCPFQYFGAQVLRLAPRSTRLDDLSPLTIGQLCHDALRACYVRLCETGWPHSPALSGSIRNQVEAAVEEAWAAYASRHGTGHALTGALARETVSALVQAVVETDQEECRTSGYQPVAFELETEGRLEVPGFAALSAIAIRGRLDRLDRRQAPPGFRVIDYKYRQARSLRLEDRDLVIGAIRAMRLQPPLYALMQVPGEAGSVAPVERVELLFLLPQADSPTERTAFESATWQGPTGGNLRRTLGTLLEGIHQGQFPMLPDRYCDHCDFTAACRRFHGPSWWRARSPMSQKLRKLRKLTVAEE